MTIANLQFVEMASVSSLRTQPHVPKTVISHAQANAETAPVMSTAERPHRLVLRTVIPLVTSRKPVEMDHATRDVVRLHRLVLRTAIRTIVVVAMEPAIVRAERTR